MLCLVGVLGDTIRRGTSCLGERIGGGVFVGIDGFDGFVVRGGFSAMVHKVKEF